MTQKLEGDEGRKMGDYIGERGGKGEMGGGVTAIFLPIQQILTGNIGGESIPQINDESD